MPRGFRGRRHLRSIGLPALISVSDLDETLDLLAFAYND